MSVSGGDRPTVMVTNDDGIDAPGLVALVRALVSSDQFQVFVCAPDRYARENFYSQVCKITWIWSFFVVIFQFPSCRGLFWHDRFIRKFNQSKRRNIILASIKMYRMRKLRDLIIEIHLASAGNWQTLEELILLLFIQPFLLFLKEK